MTKLKDIGLRAALAYIDTALGLLLAFPLLDVNVSALRTIAIAAAAPALSIVRNGLASLGAPVPNTLNK